MFKNKKKYSKFKDDFIRDFACWRADEMISMMNKNKNYNAARLNGLNLTKVVTIEMISCTTLCVIVN